MSNVLELLQEVNPEINGSMADDLRAGLVAINQQVQVDSASTDWSLNSWWQWLDVEGYNRDTLLTSLQGLCASRLDAAALADLVTACHARGDDPHGLEWVQTLIDDLDAELNGLFHTLEAEALLEDQQLMQIAGGMSKGVAAGIGVGTVLTAAVAVGVIIYSCRSARKNKALGHDAEKELENIQVEAQQRLSTVESEIGMDLRDVPDSHSLMRSSLDVGAIRNLDKDSIASVGDITKLGVEKRMAAGAKNELLNTVDEGIKDIIKSELINEIKQGTSKILESGGLGGLIQEKSKFSDRLDVKKYINSNELEELEPVVKETEALLPNNHPNVSLDDALKDAFTLFKDTESEVNERVLNALQSGDLSQVVLNDFQEQTIKHALDNGVDSVWVQEVVRNFQRLQREFDEKATKLAKDEAEGYSSDWDSMESAASEDVEAGAKEAEAKLIETGETVAREEEGLINDLP